MGYKDVAISRDGQGHYYASFVSEDEASIIYGQKDQHEDPPQGDGTASQQHQEGAFVNREAGILALDLGIKTLATGVNDRGQVNHVGGFKG